MAITIHKQELPGMGGANLHVRLPQSVEFLSVQLQQDVPALWYSFDPDAEQLDHKWMIRAAHTGERMEIYTADGWTYLGTALLHSGAYVLHYYAKKID